MQLRNAFDPDHVRAGALNVCAHTVEEVGKVYDVRFFGRILDDRLTLRHYGGHHHVHRCAHRDNVHIDMIALEPLRLRDDQAVFDPDVCPQCAEALDMLVDRSKPDIAAARQRHLSLSVFA